MIGHAAPRVSELERKRIVALRLPEASASLLADAAVYNTGPARRSRRRQRGTDLCVCAANAGDQKCSAERSCMQISWNSSSRICCVRPDAPNRVPRGASSNQWGKTRKIALSSPVVSSAVEQRLTTAGPLFDPYHPPTCICLRSACERGRSPLNRGERGNGNAGFFPRTSATGAIQCTPSTAVSSSREERLTRIAAGFKARLARPARLRTCRDGYRNRFLDPVFLPLTTAGAGVGTGWTTVLVPSSHFFSHAVTPSARTMVAADSIRGPS